jgi:hypothetical protein
VIHQAEVLHCSLINPIHDLPSHQEASTPITTIIAFPAMDQIADGLLRLTVPPEPFMRLDDTLLSNEEAKATANAMYDLVKGCYKWKWACPKTHLANTTFEDDAEHRIQNPDEEKQDYIQRMQRLEAWPQKEADRHGQWLGYALITARALDYLQQQSVKRQRLCGKSGDHHYYFNPKRFYEYTWMCLNQGHGWRSWKQSPELPEESMANPGTWYSKKAKTMVEDTIKLWNTGVKLECMFSVLVLNDLLPSPKDKELDMFIRNKVEQISAAGIRNRRLVTYVERLRPSCYQWFSNCMMSRTTQVKSTRIPRSVAGRVAKPNRGASNRLKNAVLSARIVNTMRPAQSN